jgi:cob(I)alamin adenosyltransferase
MGHRLSRIYTRTGDAGTTGLADGSRMPKHAVRIETIGALDEANSAIGYLLTQEIGAPEIRTTLTDIQHRLFDAGAELSLPGHRAITAGHVDRLETALDALNANLPPLKEFILPGGTPAAAICHLARAAVRRGERCLWRLIDEDSSAVAADAALAPWLNRLSDYLFVAARVLARQHGGSEPTWQRDS